MTVLFCVINVCKYVVIRKKKTNIDNCVGKLKIPKHPRFTFVLSCSGNDICFIVDSFMCC